MTRQTESYDNGDEGRREQIFREGSRVGFDGAGKDGHQNRKKGTVVWVEWDPGQRNYHLRIRPDEKIYDGQLIITDDDSLHIRLLDENGQDAGISGTLASGNTNLL